MRPYHEYTNYMLREYFSHEQDFARNLDLESESQFLSRIIRSVSEIARTKAEEMNLTVCAIIVRTLSVDKVSILREVFGDNDQINVGQAVKDCAGKLGLKEKIVWDTVRSVSQEIARTRGLI